MKGKIVGRGLKLRYYLDNQEVTKAEFDKAFPPKHESGNDAFCHFKPIASDAMKLHPKLIAEGVADAIKKRVPTDFTTDGRPIFRTRQHRAEYLRAYGYFDRDAGYGDPADGSSRDR